MKAEWATHPLTLQLPQHYITYCCIKTHYTACTNRRTAPFYIMVCLLTCTGNTAGNRISKLLQSTLNVNYCVIYALLSSFLLIRVDHLMKNSQMNVILLSALLFGANMSCLVAVYHSVGHKYPKGADACTCKLQT